MSNKQQLQTNNTKYASLIETLRGKAAGGSGEDVSSETNAYTSKISQLETAVTALEAELEGKASGGSGGTTEMCTVTCSVVNDNTYKPFDIYYTDGSGCICKMTTETEYYNGTLTCLKGSLIYFSILTTAPGVSYISTTGEVSLLGQQVDPVFAVNGDGSISY